MDLVGRILWNIDKTPILRDEPTWWTSASWAPKTANKIRILEKLNPDRRLSYIEMNVPKMGFTYAKGFVRN